MTTNNGWTTMNNVSALSNAACKRFKDLLLRAATI
jgi:hypothetical protein